MAVEYTHLFAYISAYNL